MHLRNRRELPNRFEILTATLSHRILNAEGAKKEDAQIEARRITNELLIRGQFSWPALLQFLRRVIRGEEKKDILYKIEEAICRVGIINTNAKKQQAIIGLLEALDIVKGKSEKGQLFEEILGVLFRLGILTRFNNNRMYGIFVEEQNILSLADGSATYGFKDKAKYNAQITSLQIPKLGYYRNQYGEQTPSLKVFNPESKAWLKIKNRLE